MLEFWLIWIISSQNSAESLSWIILFTLLENVHVLLAVWDFRWVLLQTVDKVRVETSARWLLWGSLLLVLLLLTVVLMTVILIVIVVSFIRSSTHHRSYNSMSNFRPSTKCHSWCHGSSEAGHHASALSRSSLHWCLNWSWSSSWCCWSSSWSCWSTTEHATWWWFTWWTASTSSCHFIGTNWFIYWFNFFNYGLN